MASEPSSAAPSGPAALAPAAGAPQGDSLWTRAFRWLASAEHEGMPQHVAQRIAQQRQNNEILAGWVQMSLVTVFALLYAFSRKTFGPDVMFAPVPWALGIYAAFTALRLFLAYRDRLGHAMLMVSVVFDVAVLMITVWSFHIQYGQPPAFYLKAPTLLYIFIFIALRTLSIAPGYVIFAGLVSAFGWLVLVGYAVNAPGGHELITRDYIAYMTSARILIGGEIDKVISILLVASLLAVATARSRTLLYRAVAEKEAASRLSRFFSPEVAETIVSDEQALELGQGKQTQAAAMFIDMRGFTRLASRLPPRELIGLLGEYQGVAVPVIQKHGGSITTFLGDGIMVTFGATLPSRTFAADALRAAEELLQSLEAWAKARSAAGEPAPGMGIGIAVGAVTCGAIGHEGRLEYAVIGDPVNRAAKLQNHTKVEQVRVLTTLDALEHAKAQGYAPTRELDIRRARSVAGISESLDLAALE
jgi:adenylate cyclase